MAIHRRTSATTVCLFLVLYLLQGISLGLAISIPLFLVAAGATWKDRGTFNFAFYPFSLKLIWAPLTDALYSVRFGKRKSWLIPIQLGLAVLFFLLSFYIESFIATNRVILLTVIFFAIVFLTATQDICVDGLAISLFSVTNPQWASTSQAVGQTFGRFLGSSFLLTFESANFTNRFIRAPLSLAPQTSGLFSLHQFIRCIALALLIVTTCLAIFLREKPQVSTTDGKEISSVSLIETYLSIVKLLRKKCIQHLTLISLLGPIGLVATQSMTSLALVGQGIPRENIALVNIPVTLITIIAPLLIRHTVCPLIWFARSYMLNLISAIPIAAYVYFTPHMSHSSYYYPMLILLLAFNEFANALRFAAQVGFFASISEPRIGGTYMTFLVTIHNLGFAVNSSIVLYAANWLPKRYAYVIAVGACLVFGIIWFTLSYRNLKRLQKLPTNEWHLKPEIITTDTTMPNEQGQNDHEMPLILDKETEKLT